MDGHACKLHETNNRSWIYVCECGEFGIAHQSPIERNEKTKREIALVDIARKSAQAEHREHVELVREAEAHASFARMEDHAAYMKAVTPTVTRLGRWGRG